MTIGKKINGGFGVVLSLLIAVVVLSYTIVGDVGDVVKGSQLDGELAQKEVDHLNWVKKVNTLLTDDTVTQLDVQTDALSENGSMAKGAITPNALCRSWLRC